MYKITVNDMELQTRVPMNIVVSIVNTEKMVSVDFLFLFFGFSFVLQNRSIIFNLFIFGEIIQDF